MTRVAFLSFVFVLVAGSIPLGESASAGRRHTNCDVVIYAPPESPRLRFRVSCEFSPDEINISIDRLVKHVGHRPRILHPDPGDESFCDRKRAKEPFFYEGSSTRSDPHKGFVCTGDVGETPTVLRGWFNPKGDRCSVSTGILIFGGLDCDPPVTVCPDIGLFWSGTRAQPAGCG
jgi:hypothetical protein